MIRIDTAHCDAPLDVCVKVAGTVDRWPDILPHYRWVRFDEQTSFANGVVEMAAWRPFGVVKYPAWWKSKMWHDEARPVIHYHHIAGITRGMDVRWEFAPDGPRTDIRVIHEWAGPGWPVIGGVAARYVIGPVFISAIAQRTLAGVTREAERLARA